MISVYKPRIKQWSFVLSSLLLCYGNTSAQYSSSLEKDFKAYLSLFSPVSLPVKGSSLGEIQGNELRIQKSIPTQWVEKFVLPFRKNDDAQFVSLGRVDYPGTNIILFVERRPKRILYNDTFLMVYHPKGMLLQKLLFHASYRGSLKGVMQKGFLIKLVSGNLNFVDNKYTTETIHFRINMSGFIEPLHTDKQWLLTEMPPLGRMCKVVRKYYQCLHQEKYHDIIPYFVPQVSQWLGLKNVSREKIGLEAYHFLVKKKDVFYAPDFSQLHLEGNTLKLPVKLGWNNYQATVMASFTFNKNFEITHLKEQSQ